MRLSINEIKRSINAHRKVSLHSIAQADDGIVHVSCVAGYALVEASFPPYAEHVGDLLDVISVLAVDGAIDWKVAKWIKIS
jgi:hypothetical protein